MNVSAAGSAGARHIIWANLEYCYFFLYINASSPFMPSRVIICVVCTAGIREVCGYLSRKQINATPLAQVKPKEEG